MSLSPELAKAFVKAQGAMPKLVKDSINPHLKNGYASLAAVIDTIRKPLADSGLALYQSATTTTDADGKPIVVVRSMLIHESGEYIEDELPMPILKNDAQGIGSAITYGRRYAAMAMCGLAPDDDDGNAAADALKAQSQTTTTGKAPQATKPAAPATKSTPKKSAEQLARESFHASGTELFGKDWAAARPMVIERYSANKKDATPRTSSTDLNPQELAEITNTFKTKAPGWKSWLTEVMTPKETEKVTA